MQNTRVMLMDELDSVLVESESGYVMDKRKPFEGKQYEQQKNI